MLDKATKKQRVSLLSQCGTEIRQAILEEAVANTKTAQVLFENLKDGYAYGHTDNFLEVRVKSECSLHSQLLNVRFVALNKGIIEAELMPPPERIKLK